MIRLLKCSFLIIGLFFFNQLQAGNLYKCIGVNGKVTFNQTGCVLINQETEQVKKIRGKKKASDESTFQDILIDGELHKNVLVIGNPKKLSAKKDNFRNKYDSSIKRRLERYQKSRHKKPLSKNKEQKEESLAKSQDDQHECEESRRALTSIQQAMRQGYSNAESNDYKRKYRQYSDDVHRNCK
ncbi:MAG: hypothetical protein HON94_14185 [Methylococcales bacterium]|nr:hypothetical protein [Methylococcales bacterium]MBT7410407.1 hypothetical protein [Methylococcales bacterium]